jgi:GNAT superfamily N-acetyltransferase
MLIQETTQINIQLKDGTLVLLRPVLPEDRQRLQHGLLLMSAESRHRRFFSSMSALSEEQLDYFTVVDQENHVAWIALDPSAPGLPGLGIARFIRYPDQPRMAEVAFAVIDAFQARGLGSVLLATLYLVAQARGIETLRAVVLVDNGTVAAWLRRLGASGKQGSDGVMELDLPVHRDRSRLPQNPTGKRFEKLLNQLSEGAKSPGANSGLPEPNAPATATARSDFATGTLAPAAW